VVRCNRCRGFLDHTKAEHRHLECHCPDWEELDLLPERNHTKTPRPADIDVCNPTPGYGYRLGVGFIMLNQVDEYM